MNKNILNQPKVSIIFPVKNSEDTVEKSLCSLINQTYKNIEIIVIDGFSTDNTVEIINNYKNNISFFISELDNGIGDAMNKGLKFATGDLIGILNADDYFLTNTIQVIVENYLKYPDCIIHGDCNIFFSNTKFYNSKSPSNPNLKKGMVIQHIATFVPRKFYNQIGYFDSELKISADWDFLLRCQISGIKFKKIDQPIANYSIGGTSTKNIKRLLSERHYIRKKNKLYKFFDFDSLYMNIKFLIFRSSLVEISYKIKYILKK
jgi:glycosyltransferase involved in cell wall biosynthesis